MGVGDSGNKEFDQTAQSRAIEFLADEGASTPRSIANEIFRNKGTLADFVAAMVQRLDRSLSNAEYDQALRDWNTGTNFKKLKKGKR